MKSIEDHQKPHDFIVSAADCINQDQLSLTVGDPDEGAWNAARRLASKAHTRVTLCAGAPYMPRASQLATPQLK
ncbi:hypothetical protein [Bradyrhizobium cosmicum]|uniref:hypothetical protein n=1 Tax=Bradyrhizobium cosmicum TaxID=1404864 RepID=UPI0028E85DFF|nr:hypothetical protein [Bradyrhizobium cosmicum]